jgi:dethiobiotin synthetase
MNQRYVVVGTDTGVGKTVFSAALMQALAAVGRDVSYWKPVQSGVDSIDTRRVQHLSGLDESHFLKEAYVFSEPLSPHRAAEIDGVEIDLKVLALPEVSGDLVIEAAGGLMVPLTRRNLFINQIKKWGAPVILIARTELGTINHTLLSLEALWARDITIWGLVFIGPYNEDTINTIADISGERVLGCLPVVENLDSDKLAQIFADGCDVGYF